MLADRERDACGVGFVAHIKGERSRAIVDQGLEVLRRLSHRAACGADPETGDGAGILMQLPERVLPRAKARGSASSCRERRVRGRQRVPAARSGAARRVRADRSRAAIRDEGQRVLGWRDVPIDPAHVGASRARCMPVFRQIFVAHAPRAAERVGAHALS